MAWRVAALVAVAALLAAYNRGPQWQGWVYPDRSDLTEDIPVGAFTTFEQCQEAAIARLGSLPNPDDGDYECGRACRWKPEWNINVCKETRK